MKANEAIAQRLYALAAQDARTAISTDISGIQSDWHQISNRDRYIEVSSLLKINAPHALDSALVLLPKFIEKPYHDRLSLAIARHYFLQEKLVDAIPFYESAGIANLNNVEIADAKFELAYCYFNNRQFVAASNLFAIMKEVPGKYYGPGNYYYGLLAYNDGDFKSALTSFNRIKKEPIYKPVVPYYIAELYYYMGQRDKALEAALKLIAEPEKQYYDNELHLLAAQCLFEDGRYGDALPYFESYYQNTEKIRKEELYEMGYAYYRVNEWKSAIAKFKPLSASQDSLGQTAMYLLGDCYLHTGEKESARNAFGICASMSFNAGQREAALLLNAKLSYELGYADDAMHSVNALLSDFPNSKFSPEARALQSQLYLASNNFKEAYEAIEKSGNEIPNAQAIRQRAAYGYAMQEMQKQELAEAGSLLDVALANNVDAGYNAAAIFWKSELSYRQHQYQITAENAQLFLNNESAQRLAENLSPTATKAHAALNLGYASLALKNFKEAQKAFAIAKASTQNAGTNSNASLREADALFMQKNFAAAAPIYASQMNGRGSDADYARLQSAIIAGLRGDNATKTQLLLGLISAFPASPYGSEARFELGIVQLADNKYNDAIATLQPLVALRNPVFAAKALLKIGTAEQQLSQDDKAIESYTSLIRDWKDAPERNDALQAIKSIYISRNQPDAFTKLVHDFNLPPLSEEELSNTYYNAAEAQYAASNWAGAETGFAKYLNLYPQGISAGKALYYLANSQYNLKKYTSALLGYNTVLQGNWGEFSGDAVRRAAELSMADSNYAKASSFYQLMAAHANSSADRSIAYTGLMQSAAKMKDNASAARYADTLLSLDATMLPALKDEARMYKVREKFANAQDAEALILVDSLKESPNNIVAAEARYYAAQHLLNVRKLKEAEAAASDNIKKSAGLDYWVIKSYLLLGDILVQEKDYFNARATLQSVAQHASIPALKEEAKQKLESLKTTESTKLSNE
ncbi:MAG: tetratricopeptide repeat protein [Chitinophagaceae bacterium]